MRIGLGRRCIVRLALAFFVGFSAYGCDDDPTGTDETSRLSGRWTYSASFAGAGIQCELESTDILLDGVTSSTRFDARFSGSVTNFDVVCEREGRVATLPFGGTGLVNGVLRDANLSFDFVTPNLLHTGTLDVSSMAGQVAVRLDLTSTPIDVTDTLNFVGTWEARRR